MRIVVPVKQVPHVAALRFDAERGRAIRAEVPLVLNAYDRRALGEALRLRTELSGDVTVLTMGPPSARDALDECLRLGADRAVHLCDDAFAGADTLATARAIAAAIRRLGADLVLCGQRSVDAETGVVGPMLAELLGVPCATAVIRVTPVTSSALDVERLAEDGVERRRLPLPCLLTAAERLHRPEAAPAPTPAAPPSPAPSPSAVTRPAPTQPAASPPATAPDTIQVWTAADLGLAADRLGAAGSATRVLRIATRERHRRREVVAGATDDVVERLLAALTSRESAAGPTGVEPERIGAAVVGAETVRPKLDGAGAEADRPTIAGSGTAPGGRLRRPVGGSVVVAPDPCRPWAASRLAGLARALTPEGDAAAHILDWLPNPDGAPSAHEMAAIDSRAAVEHTIGAVEAALREQEPALVLATDGDVGREALATVAARHGLALVTGVEAIRTGDDGAPLFERPAWGGGVVATVEALTTPALATVRSDALAAVRPEALASVGPNRPAPADPDAPSIAEVDPSSAVALDTAEVVIGVGTGLGDADGLVQVEHLAELLGAQVGGTRKVVDQGWLPPQRQIGMSGRQVAPRVYLALGTRGSFNHAIGIRRAGTILAVNPNPRAEIFGECDLGVVADWRDVVPALIARLSVYPSPSAEGGR